MREAQRPLPRAIWLVVAAGSFAMVGADCLGNVVQDPTFRDWCGDTLCSWTLDSGSIKRVPTWSNYDFGVSFVDTPTQITQVTGESAATCLLFTSVADIAPEAQMRLLVDFDNDGTIDSDQPLVSANWHKVQNEITAPAAYRGITFHIRKDGTGTAALAEMRVESTTGCTAPPMLQPLAFGDPCGGTGYPTPCVPALVCAIPPDSGTGLCSQCNVFTRCPNGAGCQSRGPGMPAQCGPGQSLGAQGDPCLADDDCASGACSGASVSDCSGDGGAWCAPDAAPEVDAGCGCKTVHGGTCS